MYRRQVHKYNLGSWLTGLGTKSGILSNNDGKIGLSDKAKEVGTDLLGSVALVGGLAANKVISGKLSSGAGNAIGNVGGAVGSFLGNVNPALGAIVSVGSGIIGGAVNRLAGSYLNDEFINKTNAYNNSLNTLQLASGSNEDVLNSLLGLQLALGFSKSDVGEDGIFSHKARDKYNELMAETQNANQRAVAAALGAVGNADKNMDMNMLTSYAAYGGKLFGDGGLPDLSLRPMTEEEKSFGRGVIFPPARYLYNGVKALFNAVSSSSPTSTLSRQPKGGGFGGGASGGGGATSRPHYSPRTIVERDTTITPNPIVRTFNDAFGEARRAGAKTFEFNGKTYNTELGDNPNNYDAGNRRLETIIVPDTTITELKRTVYDRDWAFGGELNTLGANFSNGMIHINNGGTHEENKYEGVPFGMDLEGNPNLVEEGEVIFNNYVWSNRLKTPKKLRDKYSLGGPLTFADAIKKMSKESEERPNDPISKNGINAWIPEFMQELEMIRLKKEEVAYAANGGQLNNKFLWGGEKFGRNTYRIGKSTVDDLVEEGKITLPKPATEKNYSFLRYAPVWGSILGVTSDLLGKTNRPNLANANTVLGASRISTPAVNSSPIGNYLKLNRRSLDELANPLNAQAAATREAVLRGANGNRGAATAGLLAADYNALNTLGDARIKLGEFNDALTLKEAEFAKDTDKYNSQMAVNTATQRNKDFLFDRDMLFRGALAYATLADAQLAAATEGRNANLSGLFNNIGNVGWEEFNRNMLLTDPSKYYWIDRSGKVHYKDKTEIDGGKPLAARGGYLTIKNRRHG